MRVIRQFVVAPLLLAAVWSPLLAQSGPSNNDPSARGVERAQATLRAYLGGSKAAATADVGSITGLVTDSRSARPLSSAQVFIAGTGLGGLTNASGRFLMINVPAGTHTVSVTLIGFSPMTRQITVTDGQATTADFALTEEALALDEIVVTGTAGQARRREVGNQITQVKIDEVDEPVTDVSSLLQGRMAGARISLGSGNVGSGADIRLRGNVSAALSNQPLIYIDGMRVQSEPISGDNGANSPYSPLNDINPDDIERVEVVKGPAATTLYGTEAAAGVIQIFTKRGGQGAPSWTAEVQQGYSYFRPLGPALPDGVPGAEHTRYMWLDQVFQKGLRQRYQMSVQGGTGDVGYFVSGAYSDEEGAVETEYQNRLSVRANTTFRPSEQLMIQFNSSLTRTDLQQAQMGNSVTSIMMTSVRGPKNYMSGRRDQETLRLLLDGKEYTNKITRTVTGITVNYTPGTDFTHRMTLGYDFAQDDNYLAQAYCWICPIGITSDFSDFVAGGQLRRNLAQTILKTFDYVGSLGFNVTSGIRSTLSFGAQGVQTESENTSTTGRHFPGVGEYTLESAATRWDMGQNKLRVITGGFFGQNQLGFGDKYFLTVGVRIDGNSAFGEALGFQVYPKVSGSWVLSDEAFWPDAGGQIKLRGAFGMAGRAPGAFDKVRTWNPVGLGDGGQAFTPQNLGNDNLGPERTTELEAGLDGSWLDGRFTADVTYFRQNTQDALFEVARPASAGGWGNQLENVGKTRNQGFEINTNATLVNTESFRWDLGVGLATNNSRIVDLGGAAPFSVGSSGWVFEGQPLPVIYDYRVLNPYEKADPIFGSDNGPTTDPSKATNVFFGPANPTQLWSASTSLGLPGGLQVSARGEMSLGAWIYNNFESNALSRTIAHPKCYNAYIIADPNWDPGGEHWANAQPAKPTTRPADMMAWEYLQCFGQARGGYNMQSSDYAELREVTLSIPVSNLLPSITGWANRVDMTISGRNLAKWLNKDLTSGHPEQDENSTDTTDSGEWRHDFVKSIAETLPPQSFVTIAIRAVF